jgi:hypothetical protein
VLVNTDGDIGGDVKNIKFCYFNIITLKNPQSNELFLENLGGRQAGSQGSKSARRQVGKDAGSGTGTEAGRSWDREGGR